MGPLEQGLPVDADGQLVAVAGEADLIDDEASECLDAAENGLDRELDGRKTDDAIALFKEIHPQMAGRKPLLVFFASF